MNPFWFPKKLVLSSCLLCCITWNLLWQYCSEMPALGSSWGACPPIHKDSPDKATLPTKPSLRTSLDLSLLVSFPHKFLEWQQNAVSTARPKRCTTWQPCPKSVVTFLESITHFFDKVLALSSDNFMNIYTFLKILRKESRWTLNFIADGCFQVFLYSILKIVHFEKIPCH